MKKTFCNFKFLADGIGWRCYKFDAGKHYILVGFLLSLHFFYYHYHAKVGKELFIIFQKNGQCKKNWIITVHVQQATTLGPELEGGPPLDMGPHWTWAMEPAFIYIYFFQWPRPEFS